MRYWFARQGWTPGYLGRQCAFLLSMILIILIECGCSAPHISITTTITPGVSAKLSPTPTPSPTPIAVPSAAPVVNPAGWTTDTSPNWCGYTLPQDAITGVRAQWTEPEVSNQVPGAYVVTWIGIGGWYQSYDNLIQIGTRATNAGSGRIVHDVWYELLPDTWYTLGTISAGDSVAASITLETGQTRDWDLSLVDLTTHQKFQTSVTYPSLRVSADYIVEDPVMITKSGRTYLPFPDFAPVTIQKADVRYTNTWLSIAAMPGIQVALVQSKKTLAVAGPLRNDTFTVKRVSP